MRWCAGPVLPGRVLPASQSKARIVAWVRRPESIGRKTSNLRLLIIFRHGRFRCDGCHKGVLLRHAGSAFWRQNERVRVIGADPSGNNQLLLHSGLDIGNVQSARRFVQIATYLYLLAFELLGFVLVIDLVRSGVGLQDVLVAGLHHGSGEGLPILRCRRRRALRRTGLIWSRWAGLCRAGLRRAGLRRAVRWACRWTRSGRRARTRAGLIAGLGKRRRQHSCHQRKDSYHSESLLHYFRSSKLSTNGYRARD